MVLLFKLTTTHGLPTFYPPLIPYTLHIPKRHSLIHTQTDRRSHKKRLISIILAPLLLSVSSCVCHISIYHKSTTWKKTDPPLDNTVVSESENKQPRFLQTHSLQVIHMIKLKIPFNYQLCTSIHCSPFLCPYFIMTYIRLWIPLRDETFSVARPLFSSFLFCDSLPQVANDFSGRFRKLSNHRNPIGIVVSKSSYQYRRIDIDCLLLPHYLHIENAYLQFFYSTPL